MVRPYPSPIYGSDAADLIEAMGLPTYGGGGDDILYGAWKSPDLSLSLASGPFQFRGVNFFGNSVLVDIEEVRLSGGDGNDTLYGTGSLDSLGGGNGNDVLVSGAAAPWRHPWGSSQNDQLIGGSGADVFLWLPLPGASVPMMSGALVLDWESGQDKIDISSFQSPKHDGWVWQGRDEAIRDGDRLHVAYHWVEAQGVSNKEANAWDTVVEFRSSETKGQVASFILRGKHELTHADFIAGPSSPLSALRDWTDDHQAQAARLYDAVFDRKPEKSGLDFWHSALKQGHGLGEIAGLFITAPEFRAKHGSMDDAGFVAQLYRTVLDREGEREGLDFWTAALIEHRAQRSDIVVGFSESAEHVAKVKAVDYLA